MAHTFQLLFVAVFMLVIGILVGYWLVHLYFVNRSRLISSKNFENLNDIKELHLKTHKENIELSKAVEDFKVWVTDSEIYIQELKLENLALNGTKSRATIIPPETDHIIKEKKVVHKRARKA